MGLRDGCIEVTRQTDHPSLVLLCIKRRHGKRFVNDDSVCGGRPWSPYLISMHPVLAPLYFGTHESHVY